ncbi:MAG TPA: protein kinase, partial [Gemmatimonadaceae bacterium]|nr:protein kinase [Gemmatimonadaceae bacterium]
ADRYRIERELGAGGMATVYLAADIKHDRKVAIKVLRPELAAVLGAERFVVEIKTTASLQHPHILPLFDSGMVDGLPFYVMPYIEGETVREKLNRETQFGVDEAVRIAREVADALDYAHRHGVIHRDIKPENILLHDGRAMVMDFGIALAVSAAAGGRMTETGLSLGTPHYMSPEQATAEKEITGRSDVYSLAIVLYEMLAGQPPHVGGSAQQIIMKIIAEPAAPVTQYRKATPPNVAAALAKALEKLPADRFEGARAFSDALANPSFATGEASVRVGTVARTSGVSWIAFAAAAGAAALALMGLTWALLRPRRIPDEPVIRVAVDLQPNERLYPAAGGSTIAISPQGDRLVYVAQRADGGHMMIRRTGEFTAVELTAAVTHSPTFSPDGRWLALVDGNQIKKVPTDGGPIVTLATMANANVRGMAWSGRDTLILGSDVGLLALPSRGGTPHRIPGVDSTVTSGYPVILPDGKSVAYTVGGSAATRHLAITSLASHRTTVFETVAGMVLGMREGHLLYVTATGELMGAPLDVARQRLSGDAIQLESGIRASGANASLASLSANGSLWYVSGQATGHLVHAAPGRPDVPLLDETRAFRDPRFSPDGKRIAVEVLEPKGSNIWIYDVASATFTLLANEASFAEWSADGRRVLFRSTHNGKMGVWWAPADGSGSAELLYEPADLFNEAVMSPDGKWLLYRTAPGVHNRDIYAVPLDGDRKPVLLVGGPAQESHPRLSPNGKWLAYESNESGRFEIYVRPFPENGARRQVSNQGGAEPIWSRSGNAIYYRIPNGGVEAATVTAGATFTVGERHGVFGTSDYLNDVTHASYDAWPDGDGFLMVKPVGGDGRPILVHNWGRLLREKLAVQR